ncbi:MAG: TonB-dependent receptor [Bacteroidetes Order II. Incertae sedis bacterium]|nr:TonB-dependent receptor [Bacteroidetes Order II. bacterium]
MNARYLILLFLSLYYCASVTFAQTAKIVGTVWEDTRPMPGATLILKPLQKGTITDPDGRFALTELSAGKYLLVVSFVGYKPYEVQVEIQAGETKTLNINLVSENAEEDLLVRVIPSTTIEANRPFSAAGIQEIRQLDLTIRPARTTQDLLQRVPGLIIAQHAGGGKAEQIYLRNFDADHGTDVAISVDGLPVNMVSHGHGQGYADLHFVIAETIEQMSVSKGPYFASLGNLATAGAVAFRTKEKLIEQMVKIEGGQFGTIRGTALLQPITQNGQNLYVAAQIHHSDGPFIEKQNFDRYNVFTKYRKQRTLTKSLTVAASAFGAAWDASGQIPQRAIDSGLITRWGAIDSGEGGETSRQNLSLTFEDTGSVFPFKAQFWASRYQFGLFSNFTFFLEDALKGDMIEQFDNRFLGGLNTEMSLGRRTKMGFQMRHDRANVGLMKSPERIRTEEWANADIKETNTALWFEHIIPLMPVLELQVGLRADDFRFKVKNHATSDLPRADGSAHQQILSPKFNLAYRPTSHWAVFVNLGSGFHSNDARNAVLGQYAHDLAATLQKEGKTQAQIADAFRTRFIEPEQAETKTLPRALGAEIGTRWFSNDQKTTIALAFWRLDLEREFVYVGDGGFTELSDPTRRYGIDVEAQAQLIPSLFASADFILSNGKIVGAPSGENHIPLAPRLTTQGSLTWRNVHGFSAHFQGRHIGARPANEDNSVRALGHTLFNTGASYRFRRAEVSFSIENLFDTDWNEAQFDTTSRLKNEVAPVSELHFTPGNPRNIQAGISVFF